METMFIFLRYGILIDGSQNNEKKKVPLNPPQIEHYNFEVKKAFEEILKRKTGQIILEGIRASGWYVVVMPFGTIPATMELLDGPRWSGGRE